MTASRSAAAPVPSFAPEVDWRNHNGNHVTPIKDQGFCGSCVSFCTTAMVESMASIEKGELLDLSEADLHFCSSHGENCDGWWPNEAFDQVRMRVCPMEPVSHIAAHSILRHRTQSVLSVQTGMLAP
jgi:C1A family cysteine protease